MHMQCVNAPDMAGKTLLLQTRNDLFARPDQSLHTSCDPGPLESA